MLFQEESGEYITFTCEKCGKSHKRNKSNCEVKGAKYYFNPPILCSCGNTESASYKSRMVGKSQSDFQDIRNDNVSDDVIKCPKCNSTQITAGNKGMD